MSSSQSHHRRSTRNRFETRESLVTDHRSDCRHQTRQARRTCPPLFLSNFTLLAFDPASLTLSFTSTYPNHHVQVFWIGSTVTYLTRQIILPSRCHLNITQLAKLHTDHTTTPSSSQSLILHHDALPVTNVALTHRHYPCSRLALSDSTRHCSLALRLCTIRDKPHRSMSSSLHSSDTRLQRERFHLGKLILFPRRRQRRYLQQQRQNVLQLWLYPRHGLHQQPGMERVFWTISGQ